MPKQEPALDTRDAHFVAKNVSTWLGNPLSRGMLKFACSSGKNGIRLDYGLRRYSGLIDNGGDFWDNMAYRFVKFTVEKGASAFGVEREKMMEGLRDTVFRRALVNVLGGIAEHGVQKPQVSIAPFLVVWNYTHCCNLRCKHCYENSDGTFLPDELSTEEAKKAIDHFAEIGVVGIAFSGGEPLIRKDFFEVARHARKKGFYVSVATNGTLVTPEIARRLRKTGVEYVEVSLDGFEKEHDALRRVPGAWKKACRGIRNCLEAGIDTCVATTVTKRNYRNLEKFMDFVENKLGAKRLIVFNYIPTGRGKCIIRDDLNPDERERVNKLIYERLVDDHCKLIALSTAPLYARIATEHAGPAIATHFVNQTIMDAMKGKTKGLAEFIGGCGAGRLYCGLEPNGDVEPCVGPDTHILSYDGEITKIKDIKVGYNPISFNIDKLELEPDSCTAKRKLKKKIYKLKTDTDTVYASANHPFFVLYDGVIRKMKLENLKRGYYIVKARKTGIKGKRQTLPKLFFNHYKLSENGVLSINAKVTNVSKLAQKIGVTRDTLLEFLGRRSDRDRIIGLQRDTLIRLCKELKISFSKRYFEPSGFHSYSIPKYLSPELSQFLGYFIGDGYARSDNGVISCKDADKTVSEYYAALFYKIFGVKPKIKWNNGSYQIIVHSIPLAKLFLALVGSNDGTCTLKSLQRNVPIIIQKSENKCVKAFLRGLFDAEGSVGPRWASLTSGSEDLLQQVKMLMLRFGVSASNPNNVRGLGKGHKITIPLGYIEGFKRNIGFYSKKKKSKLKKVVKRRNVKYPRYPFNKELKTIYNLLKIRKPQIVNHSDISRDDCIRLIEKAKKRVSELKCGREILLTHAEAANIIDLDRRTFTYRLNRNIYIPKYKKIIDLKHQRIGEANRIIRKIVAFINSDIEVDKIREITNTGSGYVYDITTTRNHTFLANSLAVHNCVFMQIKLGNIREQSLKEIWKTHPLLKKMRDRDSFKGCGKCEHKHICGGCRARAYGYYGDVQGPDPGCMLNKSYWNSLKNGHSNGNKGRKCGK